MIATKANDPEKLIISQSSYNASYIFITNNDDKYKMFLKVCKANKIEYLKILDCRKYIENIEERYTLLFEADAQQHTFMVLCKYNYPKLIETILYSKRICDSTKCKNKREGCSVLYLIDDKIFRFAFFRVCKKKHYDIIKLFLNHPDFYKYIYEKYSRNFIIVQFEISDDITVLKMVVDKYYEIETGHMDEKNSI